MHFYYSNLLLSMHKNAFQAEGEKQIKNIAGIFSLSQLPPHNSHDIEIKKCLLDEGVKHFPRK